MHHLIVTVETFGHELETDESVREMERGAGSDNVLELDSGLMSELVIHTVK